MVRVDVGEGGDGQAGEDEEEEGEEGGEDARALMMMMIIIMIITRPRPAFGRLGLGRLSGRKTLGMSPRLASRLWRSARRESDFSIYRREGHFFVTDRQR